MNNTNIYAAIRKNKNGRPWEGVTIAELKCFIRIYIYMGIFKCSRIEDCRDTYDSHPAHQIVRTMSLMRFQPIKRFVQICDPSDINGKWNVSKSMNLLRHLCYLVFTSSKHLFFSKKKCVIRWIDCSAEWTVIEVCAHTEHADWLWVSDLGSLQLWIHLLCYTTLYHETMKRLRQLQARSFSFVYTGDAVEW